MYAGAPTGRATDMLVVPAMSVTWLAAPERSIQEAVVSDPAGCQESAVYMAISPSGTGKDAGNREAETNVVRGMRSQME